MAMSLEISGHPGLISTASNYDCFDSGNMALKSLSSSSSTTLKNVCRECEMIKASGLVYIMT